MGEAPGRSGARAVLELDARPDSVGVWLASVWAHREVLAILARSDFQVRYKRTSFGIAWAVAVPVLQAVVLAVVFSQFIRIEGGVDYPAFVLGGVLAWSYFSQTLSTGSTAIVDGSALTEKVWFPRALLVAVPALSNLVGLAASILALVVAMPFLGVGIGPRIVLLVPAGALLVAFSLSLSLVLSALHVYFRDVRFLVQAALLVWFYLTPIVYPKSLVGGLGPFLDANPMTGVVTVFRLATVGGVGPSVRPVLVAVVATVGLGAVAVQAHRHHDRLFVDLL